MRETPGRLVPEPLLQRRQLPGEDVVGLHVEDRGRPIGRRRDDRGHLRGRGGLHLRAPAGPQALQVRDQIGELAEREVGIARHDRATVLVDVPGSLDQHCVGVQDRFHEVFRRVVASHPGQVGPDTARVITRGEVFSLDVMTGVTAEIHEGLAAGIDVSRWSCEPPTRRDTTGLVESGHRDAHAGCRWRAYPRLWRPPLRRLAGREQGCQPDYQAPSRWSHVLPNTPQGERLPWSVLSSGRSIFSTRQSVP